MANATSEGSGHTIIAAAAVNNFLREATGLPSTFFVTLQKGRINADGSLEAQYNFSSSTAPPAPTSAETVEASPS